MGLRTISRGYEPQTFPFTRCWLCSPCGGCHGHDPSCRANTYYSGPVSDHFDGKHFFNPGGDQPRGFADFLRWQLGDKAEPWPETFPSPVAQDKPPERVGTGQLRVSFVGHASFLIQMDGQNILLDPHFAERASPVGFAGPRRLNAPGIPFEVLPKIDTVLVSHNHLRPSRSRHASPPLGPGQAAHARALGNDTIIRADRPDIVVEAGDWGDTATLGPGLRLFFERPSIGPHVVRLTGAMRSGRRLSSPDAGASSGSLAIPASAMAGCSAR